MTGEGLTARICGLGFVAPGISGWAEAAAILTGESLWQPAPLVIPAAEFLPVAERRRVGKAVRLALACGHEAVAASGLDAAGIASVFASADVDAENTHQICLALTEAQPSLSPTRFHNSVQNAVSGYWTILTGSRLPTTVVMGTDEVLAQGLLEAMSQAVLEAGPVLLVVFDMAMPEPLYSTHPIEGGGALALVLDARPGHGSGEGRGEGPTISVELIRRPAAGASAMPLPLDSAAPSESIDPGLPADLQRVHPIGCALPMLAQLARLARPVPPAGISVGAAEQSPMHLHLDGYHSLRITLEP